MIHFWKNVSIFIDYGKCLVMSCQNRKKNEKYISTTIQPTTSVWLGHNSKVKWNRKKTDRNEIEKKQIINRIATC